MSEQRIENLCVGLLQMPGCFSVRFFAVRRLPAVGIPVLKRAGRYGSRPFFVCVGGAPDLSAAMTRPCLRDAGTYDFRTKWFLIFFKKNRNPLFFCRPADRRPATLPPCHFAVLLLCRLAARRLAARRLAARCLVPCRPLPCHLAVLPPCRPPPAALPTRPNGACRFLALRSVRGKSACGETPFFA